VTRELVNLTQTLEQLLSGRTMESAEGFLPRVLTIPFIDDELFSPGWLQSTRQHKLAATDSVAFIRAVRQHDPEQSLSP